jgi:hypothetical protein
MGSDAPGLSHTLPTDQIEFALRLNRCTQVFPLPALYDLASQAKQGGHILSPAPTRFGRQYRCLCNTQSSRKPIQYLSAGNEMAQTRRIGKPNRRAYLLTAPRFSPYLSGQIKPTDPFVHLPGRIICYLLLAIPL